MAEKSIRLIQEQANGTLKEIEFLPSPGDYIAFDENLDPSLNSPVGAAMLAPLRGILLPVDGYVLQTGLPAIGTNDLTLICIAKLSTATGTDLFHTVFSNMSSTVNSGGITLSYRFNTGWQVRMGTSFVQNFTIGGIGFDDGDWHIIEMTVDRDGLVTVFVDGISVGVPQDISAQAGNLSNTSYAWGGHTSGSANNGLDDSFAGYGFAFNEILTKTQRDKIKANPLNAFSLDSLMLSANFGYGSGTTIPDEHNSTVWSPQNGNFTLINPLP